MRVCIDNLQSQIVELPKTEADIKRPCPKDFSVIQSLVQNSHILRGNVVHHCRLLDLTCASSLINHVSNQISTIAKWLRPKPLDPSVAWLSSYL